MNKNVSDIFNEKENVNIGYIVAGYPSIDFTTEFLLKLDSTSIDILEIGIPYSDPLADGKLISNASFIASEAGILQLLAENNEYPNIFLTLGSESLNCWIIFLTSSTVKSR